MKNGEFYKKRLKIARKKVEESTAYTIPSWPFRKIINLLGAGITKIPTIVPKDRPIARFIEEEKDEDESKKQKKDVWKRKVNSEPKFYNFSDIQSEVLKKIMESRDANNSNNELDAKSILHIMNDCISGEKNQESLLSKQNKRNENFSKSMIRDESDERIRESGGKNIYYDKQLGGEKNRIANELSYYIEKYLEKKPKDKQFIEPEDLECQDGEKTLHPLSDYIEHHTKRDKISYIKVCMVALPVIAVGVMMAVAITNPIVVCIGAALIALGALAVIATAVYKNKGMDKKKFTETIRNEEVKRFEELKQEVQGEMNRRQEEKNEKKTTTGVTSNVQQTQLLNTNPNENDLPSLDGIQPVDINTTKYKENLKKFEEGEAERRALIRNKSFNNEV